MTWSSRRAGARWNDSHGDMSHWWRVTYGLCDGGVSEEIGEWGNMKCYDGVMMTRTRISYHWPFGIGIHQTLVGSGGFPHKGHLTWCFPAFFIVTGLSLLMNKQSNFRWFGTPRCSCEVTVRHWIERGVSRWSALWWWSEWRVSEWVSDIVCGFTKLLYMEQKSHICRFAHGKKNTHCVFQNSISSSASHAHVLIYMYLIL